MLLVASSNSESIAIVARFCLLVSFLTGTILLMSVAEATKFPMEFVISTMMTGNIMMHLNKKQITKIYHSKNYSFIPSSLRRRQRKSDSLFIDVASYVRRDIKVIPKSIFPNYHRSLSPSTTLNYSKLTDNDDHYCYHYRPRRRQLYPSCTGTRSFSKNIDTPLDSLLTSTAQLMMSHDGDNVELDDVNHDDHDDFTSDTAMRTPMGDTSNEDHHNHTDRIVRARTLQWLRQIVIGYNLCPFALRPYQNHQIKIVVVRGRGCSSTNANSDSGQDDDDVIVQQVQNEIELLVQSTSLSKNDDKNDQTPTTTLIVCPECYPNDFLSYLNVVHTIEDMIDNTSSSSSSSTEYNGIVQLASFHPQYCFDGSTDRTDPDNCTNQSPYPTFHLLREIDVTHVVETLLPNQDSSIVWSRNVDLLRTLHDELSPTEFTSIVTIPDILPNQSQQLLPVPANDDNDDDDDTAPTQKQETKINRDNELLFRVRQILRRFPITLLRNR